MLGNWELFGFNFSLLAIMLVSLILAVNIWLGSRKNVHSTHAGHVDTMAGDEGDD